MSVLDRIDDALLGAAAHASGAVRDHLGVDQWSQSRFLLNGYMALICLSLALAYAAQGFRIENVLMLILWSWHYHVARTTIDRYASQRDGSARLRVIERPYRRLYVPSFTGFLIITATSMNAHGAALAAAFVSMIAVHYVKACEMPPASPQVSRRIAFGF